MPSVPGPGERRKSTGRRACSCQTDTTCPSSKHLLPMTNRKGTLKTLIRNTGTILSSYLEETTSVDFDDHLGREEQAGGQIAGERQRLEERVLLEGLWRVERHRDEADECAEPQQTLHPQLFIEGR